MSNWWMFDNHTFRRLSDDAEEAVIEAMALQDDDSYGSFGVKREGEPSYMIHGGGDANEFRRGMLAWLYDKQSDRLRSRNEQLEAALREIEAMDTEHNRSGAGPAAIKFSNAIVVARKALSADPEQGEHDQCWECGKLNPAGLTGCGIDSPTCPTFGTTPRHRFVEWKRGICERCDREEEHPIHRSDSEPAGDECPCGLTAAKCAEVQPCHGNWSNPAEVDPKLAPEPAPTPDGGEGALASELEGLSEASHARADELRSVPYLRGRPARERQIAHHEGAADAYMQAAIMVRRSPREPRVPEAVRRLPKKWEREWASSTSRLTQDAAYQRGKSAAGKELSCALRAPTSEELNEKRREQRDKYRPPGGWKLVPVEPTAQMWADGYDEYERAMLASRHNVKEAERRKWEAMLAAAPQPDTQDGE